jgi:predicted transcriptional regulator
MKPKDLSKLEQQVMNVVWKLGPCSSTEVIAEFTKRRKLADTTIRTVLTNLREKGYVEPMPTVERGFRLRPVVERETYLQRFLKNIVTNLFGGSSQQAILYLLKDNNISTEEMEEIHRSIEDAKKKSPREGKSS